MHYVMSQFIQSYANQIELNRLTPYQRWQAENKGNILKGLDWPNEDIENTEVSEWMERQAEIIEQKETEG